MHAVLRVISDTADSRTAVIRNGKVVEVGRTSWADFSVPQDESMQDVHFSLEFQQGRCTVRNLKPDGETLLNGSPVSESAVANGDQIIAGETTFSVTFDGVDSEDTGNGENLPEGEADISGSGFAHVAITSAAEIAAKCEFEEDSEPLLEDAMTPRRFLEQLVENGHFQDAIAFLAAALPIREAVWWAVVSAEEMCAAAAGDREIAALAAARTWATDPTEENRRAAETVSVADPDGTAAGYAAMAAFYSEGSMVAPDMPETPAPEGLAAVMAGSAVRVAVLSGDPATLEDNYRTVLQLGVGVADGNDRWDEE